MSRQQIVQWVKSHCRLKHAFTNNCEGGVLMVDIYHESGSSRLFIMPYHFNEMVEYINQRQQPNQLSLF